MTNETFKNIINKNYNFKHLKILLIKIIIFIN